MRARTPQPIQDAADAFDTLPGVGPRAALRYAYWLATQPKEVVRQIAKSIHNITEQLNRCSVCGMWSDAPLCQVCKDPERDTTVLCVVAASQDIRIVEDSGIFRGRYHVTNGTINPIEGRTADTLNIPALIERLKQHPEIHEVIFAFDPDMAGDATSLYLSRTLKDFPITISRLARGIQHGAQLEYADGTTIADALENRRKV